MEMQDLINQSLEKLQLFDPESVVEDFADNNPLPAEVGLRDVRNKTGSGYYCWLPGLIELLQPKQIVELGGAMGVADIMILRTLSEDDHLYSVTLAENGLEFCYIKKNYPNFIPVVGDDLDLDNWPKDLDWDQVDLIFFDSEHSEDQLTKELDLYFPLLKKGTILLFDDIHLNPGMDNVWRSLKCEKYDLTSSLHWSGFGLAKKDVDTWR